ELEFTVYVDDAGRAVSAADVDDGHDKRTGAKVAARKIDEADVVKDGERFVLRAQPEITVDARAHKMSKSRGNVVNPDEIVARHGADAFRLYEMFLGPLEQVKPWSTTGVDGTHRFLNRVWRLFVVNVDGSGDDGRGGGYGSGSGAELNPSIARIEPTREQLRLLHHTIAKVTDDIEALRLNTAIAALMELTNAAYKWERVPVAVAEPFVLLLSPLAPHLAEELWALLGHERSLAYEPWPAADPALLQAETLEIPVQVNGKVRGKVVVPADADQASVVRAAREDANVQRHLEGKEIRRAVYVPGRILNFVVGA
ncbi:MAG TPA: class I tRNA ligase family protein, partial [Gammaproteobacteria bacterium]|nr:class I tRNA ligase family protein [Gammaproteobacteria bacterium]